MSSNNRQQKSDSEKEKARLMNGIDINQERNEHEDNKRAIGSCVSDFSIVKELGRGSYGVVYRAISNINKKEYVLKKINIKHMSAKHQKEALKEAQILRKVRHDNIIRYYTSFVEHECLYIVMEYADGGDLQQLLRYRREKKKQFSESEVWEFAQDLIKAVDYLHKNNIIHRDIKTLNIFLTKDRKVKLGDLGVSKIVSSQAALQGTRVGTPLYLAPELVKQQPYDFKVDIWAIGIVLYHISALEPPFQGENLIALGFNIVHKFPKPLPSGYSPKLVSFINKLLEKNPLSRPKTSELVEGFLKKNERPQTGNPLTQSQSSSQWQNNQNGRGYQSQISSDKIEVFDKGNYNILNKIIEEDSDMAAAFGHRIDKKKSLETDAFPQDNRILPQSSVAPYHMRRPQTSIARDKEKVIRSQRISDINNDYNNIKLTKNNSNFIEQNLFDNDSSGIKNYKNSKQQQNPDSGEGSLSTQNNQNNNTNNNNNSNNNNNHKNNNSKNNNKNEEEDKNIAYGQMKNESNINKNISKNKEIMTYNKKKMSLITESSSGIQNTKEDESSKKKINNNNNPSSRQQSTHGQLFQMPNNNFITPSNEDKSNKEDKKNKQEDLSNQKPTLPISNSTHTHQIDTNQLNSHRILTATQDKKTSDNHKLQKNNSVSNPNKLLFDQKHNQIQSLEVDQNSNNNNKQNQIEEVQIKQKPNIDIFQSQVRMSKENTPDSKNIKITKQQKDAIQQQHQQQRVLSQASNLKDTKEGKEIKDYLKDNLSNNNTANAAKNDVKPQNPLVAYFNISKSMSDNLSNNFKIRPFSAQTKPRQSELVKKMDINQFVKNENTSSQSKDAFKLEQIIKEFKQEAQKIREAPMNIYGNSNINNNNNQALISPNSSNKNQVDNKKNQKAPSSINPQSQGIQNQQMKKDNVNNEEKMKKEESQISVGNENIIRPQSAHPLVGNRQNKVFNQFNNRYVAGASPNQIMPGFNSPFQTNSTTSHKSIVNNFIKNSIGKMNNNVIIDHPPPNKPSKENDTNYFFYRIDNVEREFNDEINPQSTKSSSQKMDITQKIKSVTATNFYKDTNQMTQSIKGGNSVQIDNTQNPQIPKEKQSQGRVLVLNNTRPQTSTGAKKKYTIKDLVSDQQVYRSNQPVSQLI